LPDVRGREGILKVHAKNVKLAPGVDLSIIARGTPGFSGAELANLLNEAAILSAQRAKNANPADAEAWLILGGAYEMIGNKTAARAAYKSCASNATGSRVSECKALLQ